MEYEIIEIESICPDGVDIETHAEEVEAEGIAAMNAVGGKLTQKDLWILKEIGKVLLRLIFHIPVTP